MDVQVEHGPKLPPQVAQAVHNQESFAEGAFSGAVLLGLVIVIGAIIFSFFNK